MKYIYQIQRQVRRNYVKIIADLKLLFNELALEMLVLFELFMRLYLVIFYCNCYLLSLFVGLLV